jgi:hypothetical protein
MNILKQLGKILLVSVVMIIIPNCTYAEEGISLAGKWSFRIGGDTISEGDFLDEIILPNSLQRAGFGNDVTSKTKWIGCLRDTSWLKYSGKQPDGSFKVAGWLQPKKHYLGKAWYRKEIIIPESWNNKRIRLFLERVHCTSQIFVDGKKFGTQNSLSTPHIFDLGHLSTGKHILTICIDNNLPAPVGINAHCVTDHTQTAWNGVVGRMEIQPFPEKYIDYIMVFPDVKHKKALLKIFFAGDENIEGASLSIKIKMQGGKKSIQTLNIKVPPGKTLEKTVEFAKIAEWDEFDRNIYKLTAELKGKNGAEQLYHTQFGFYTHQIENQQFVINGRPTLMRGTLDCGAFPMTGSPDMSIDYWLNVFKVCKSMGVNHVRYHSWTPPEVAFFAADEMGIYLQCENAWANVLNKELEHFVMLDSERVIKRFGNHPSFMMAAYGNEPGGVKKGKKGEVWLAEWVDNIRKLDGNRKFLVSAAGWGITKNSDYNDVMRGMRVYPWGAGLRASINANPPEFASDFSGMTKKNPAKTYVGHESGQWCVFPDFDEIPLYTGFLQPENLKIFKKNMQNNHLFPKWKDFFNASGKLQTLCYKFETEKLRRTKGCGGYQLLGINDFPGQGTAPVGSVNVFWKVKSFTSPEEYRCFNGQTVILAKFTKLVFKAGETVEFAIDVSHYGEKPMKNVQLEWNLTDTKGSLLKAGKIPISEIPLGLSNILKKFSIKFDDLKTPAQYRMNFKIADTDIRNYYDLWLYPADSKNALPEKLFLTTSLDDALKELKKGRKVLLAPPPEAIRQPAERKPVIGFSTIFWNTVWANRQPPTIMGVNPDTNHPLFSDFPTENYSNYQWWYIITETLRPLWLDGLPPEFTPLLYVIDDWFTNRRLAFLIEAKVGDGKLLISSVPVSEPAKKNFVLNQFRNSIIEYMKSSKFNPEQTLSAEQLKTVIDESDPTLKIKKDKKN